MCTLDRISSLLNSKGKKQKDLTDFLGLTKNTYSNWKSGNNTSYMKYLPQIAEYLNVSIDYLLGKENSPLSLDSGLSAEQREIINLFDSAPPELQAAALAVLKSAEVSHKLQDGAGAKK